jgi:hypothetical protein
LEIDTPSRLILYWKRLGIDNYCSICYKYINKRKLLCYGERCPVRGAEGARDWVSKLSGKRITVTKTSGDASARRPKGQPVIRYWVISQVEEQGVIFNKIAPCFIWVAE